MNIFRNKKMLCAALLATCVAAGCSNGQSADASSSSASAAPASEINVLTREDGSGTRSAFIELFGVEQKQDDGSKKDLTTPKAAVTNSTSVMLTNVSADPNAIGYVSMGSLNDTVKSVNIYGAAAETANVENGTYKISRPFNLVYKESNLSEPAADLIAFINSKEGQTIVAEEGYIPVADAGAYQKSGASGKVTVSGSSSVTPLMQKIVEAYQTANGDVTVEIQQSDSSSGISDATDEISDLGMSSRELKDEEKSAGLTTLTIANDGIAVIVSPENEISELTSDDVQKIYTGEITEWSQVSK